jgi:hypothetical protein
MRRGLMAWDPKEIPIEALTARTRRLQDELERADRDAIILYTNFIRSAAVSYLTAFSPYWADGVLLVPREGGPVFATTLSKRVGEWIQTVKPIGDLVTSPTPARVLGQILTEKKARRVSILELDAFPSGLYQELAAAAPGIEVVDGTKIYAAARTIDDVERRLMIRADEIASAALENVDARRTNTAGNAVGEVEKSARMHGAEEVYVAIACDLDRDRRFARVSGALPLGTRFAIRATVAYKGTWVRRIRTYARNQRDRVAIDLANRWFETYLRAPDGERPRGKLHASLPSEAKGMHWSAEGPLGTRPLAVLASNDGDLMSLSSAPVFTAYFEISGVPWHGAGLMQGPA